MRDDTGRTPAAPAAVDESAHFRCDVTAGNGVESAVRAVGGVPTLGGGLRVARRAVSGGRRGAAV
jgi:hypothetical protein